MITLSDGRNELWQWDTNRKLNVDADCSQVHFSNKVYGRSIDVDIVSGTVFIPDILLQTDKDLYVWAFVGTPENGHTKISKVFKVNRRNKPADYVFTPVDQLTLEEIKEIAESVREDADNGLFKGDKGDKGDAFTYQDFTEEQLAALKGDPGYTPVKGVDYFDGKDGVSVTHRWNGTTLTVTSASGTSSADLKGEKGDPFVYSDFTAAQLAALKGKKGDPGYTPIKGKDYVDGKDGYTPVKGVDYTDGLDGIGIVNITSSRPVVDPEGNRYSTLYIDTARPDGTDSKRYSFQVQHGKNGVDGTKGEPPYVFTTTYTAKTSNIGSSYDIPISTIDNSKKAVEKGDLLISNEGNLYRALSDDMAGATIIVGELLAVLKGEPGGVQTVNGVKPDANGNVQIEIPEGSGIEVTAKPGQLIRVKEVDENGNPTTWEAVPWGYTEGTVYADGEYTSKFRDGYGVFGISINDGLEAIPENMSVVFDGVRYTNLQSGEIPGMGFVFGNLSFMNAAMGTAYENTGEPFIVGVSTSGMTVFLMTETESKTHTLTVKINEAVHPIPGELLPEALQFGDKEVVILPETEMTIATNPDVGMATAVFTPSTIPVEGAVYHVTYAGVEYECAAIVIDEGLYYFGNTAMMDGVDNGMPIGVMVYESEGFGMVISFAGETTANVSITGVHPVPIDVKYAPEPAFIDMTALGLGEVNNFTNVELIFTDADARKNIEKQFRAALKQGIIKVKFDYSIKHRNMLYVGDYVGELGGYITLPMIIRGDYEYCTMSSLLEDNIIHMDYSNGTFSAIARRLTLATEV